MPISDPVKEPQTSAPATPAKPSVPIFPGSSAPGKLTPPPATPQPVEPVKHKYGNFIEPDPDVILNDPILGQKFMDRFYPQTPTSTPRGFWEDPRRIARYALGQRALPPGSPTPTWMDSRLNEVYDYLSAKNKGMPWYYWDNLTDDDPALPIMREMTLPPRSAVRDDELPFYSQEVAGGAYAAPEPTPAPGIAGVPGGSGGPAGYAPDGSVKGDEITGLPADQFNDLLWWQKIARYVYPKVGNIMLAQMGAKVGSAFGPAGTAVGAAAGWGAQELINTSTEMQTDAEGNPILDAQGKPIPKYPLLYPVGQFTNGVFGVLNWGAMQVDQSMGLLNQIASSLTEPGKYGDITRIIGSLEQLKASYLAGGMAYNALPHDSNVALQMEAKMRGGSASGLEKVEQWDLEHNTPTVWYSPEGTKAGAWAMAQCREELLTNRTTPPEEIVAKWAGRFGFVGDLQNLGGQILIDPMNKLPKVEMKVGELVSGRVGNEAAAAAFSEAHDFVDAAQRYGQKLRQMPQAEAAEHNAFSRWIAGLNDAGERKDLKPGGGKFLDRMLGVDAKSRATELLHLTVDGVGTMIHMYGRDETGALDPERTLHTLRALSGTTPGEAAVMVDGSPAPRWYTSAEGQAVSLAVRQTMPVLEELLDQYRVTRPNAAIVARVAEAMGITPEKLIKDFHEADTAKAETLYTQFRQALERRAGAGDEAAGRMLETLRTDPELRALRGEALKKIADTFGAKDGIPYRPSHMVAQILDALERGVSKYSVTYFGVKPAPALMRLSEVLKKAQGMVILGLNPNYAINNAINNIVTMAWDGLFSLESHADRMREIDEYGVTMSRMRQGIGAADMGEVPGTGRSMGAEIRAAGRGSDVLQAASDLLGRASKYAPFTWAAGKIEAWSSEVAMFKAFKDYMTQLWIPGKGLRRMSADDRLALNAVQPGLAERIERAASRGKNRQQIEQAVFSGLQRKSLADVLSPDERTLIDQIAPGVVDRLDAAVAAAADDNAVLDAVNSARQELEAGKTHQVQRAMAAIVQHTRAKVTTERAQGLIDIAQGVHNSFLEFWMQHSLEMDTLAEEAELAPNEYARRAVWDTGLRLADERWHQFTNIEGAKWLGIYQGLGADIGSTEYAGYMARLLDLHDIRQGFYSERKAATVEYEQAVDQLRASGMAEADVKRAKADLWKARGERLNKAYVNFLLAEDGAQAALDDAFVEQYKAQFPDDPSAETRARAWREGQAKIRRQHAIAEAVYRTGKLPEELASAWGKGLLPAETVSAIRDLNHGMPDWMLNWKDRPVIAKKFYNDIYRPLIQEMIDANHASTPEQQPPDTPPQPLIQVGVEHVDRGRVQELVDSGLPQKQAIEQARTEAEAAANDRRLDPNLDHLRKAIDAMTPEEKDLALQQLRNEIMVDPMTGGKSLRAYAVADKLPTQVMLDVSGLKSVNDTWGHAAGDVLIRAYGELLDRLTPEAYHIHGDEFVVQATDAATAARLVEQIRTQLANVVLEFEDENGQTHLVTGFDLHYGWGDTLDGADADLNRRRTAGPAGGGDERLRNRVHEIASQIEAESHPPAGRDTGQPAGGEPPAAAAEPVKPAPVAAPTPPGIQDLRSLAASYGVPVQASNGLPNDTHLLNIIRKYYAGVTGLDQVTREMAATALDAWKANHSPLSPEMQAQMDQIRVRARATVLERNLETLSLAAPEHQTRDIAYRVLSESFPREEADALITVWDQIGKTWAQENGKTLADWYDTFITEGRGQVQAGGEGMPQGANLWDTPSQAISSARTSINAARLPAAISQIDWKPGTRNADIGGGRFDNVTQYLSGREVENIIYDPFNRDQTWNDRAVAKIRDGQADTATVNNVLNVIAESDARAQVIRQAANTLKEGGTAYFQIYEGDGSGVGRATAAGWQENRPTQAYLAEIGQVFQDVTRRGNLIEARNPRQEIAFAQREGMSPEQLDNYARALVRSGPEALAQAIRYEDDPQTRIAILDAAHNLDAEMAEQVARSNLAILAQGENGLTHWLLDGRAVIQFFSSANVSTGVHEVAHVWLPQLGDADSATVADWLTHDYGMTLEDGWQRTNREAHEHFARGFEHYLAEGEAPRGAASGITAVFAKFKTWMLSIYKHLTGSSIDVKLSEPMKALFDRWMGEDQATPLKRGDTFTFQGRDYQIERIDEGGVHATDLTGRYPIIRAWSWDQFNRTGLTIDPEYIPDPKTKADFIAQWDTAVATLAKYPQGDVTHWTMLTNAERIAEAPEDAVAALNLRRQIIETARRQGWYDELHARPGVDETRAQLAKAAEPKPEPGWVERATGVNLAQLVETIQADLRAGGIAQFATRTRIYEISDPDLIRIKGENIQHYAGKTEGWVTLTPDEVADLGRRYGMGLLANTHETYPPHPIYQGYQRIPENFYIHQMDGKTGKDLGFVQVEGEPLNYPELAGYDWFVYQEPGKAKKRLWITTEGLTGAAGPSSLSRQEAITQLRDLMSRPEKSQALAKMMQDYINKHGVTPRYRTAEGEPTPVEPASPAAAEPARAAAPEPVREPVYNPSLPADVWQHPGEIGYQQGVDKLLDLLAGNLERIMAMPKSRDFEAFVREQTGMDLGDEHQLNLAYDTLEGAFNWELRRVRSELDARNAPLAERLAVMDAYEQRITKARRTLAKMELQQFSTPLTISEAAGYAGDVQPGDRVLEPTAGTANLVDRFFARPGVQVLVNELDPGRRAVLAALGYDPTGLNLMGSEWVIGPDGKKLPPLASVVITNPPWGAYSTGKYGKAVAFRDMTTGRTVLPNDWSQRFTYLILQRMQEGGRLVGVMPTNWLYTTDRTTRAITPHRSDFMNWLAESYWIRGVVESPQGAYLSRSTGVGSLLVVLDKMKAPADARPPIEYWGERAPKNWDAYAAIVGNFAEGGEAARRGLDVSHAQDAFRSTRPAGEPERPVSGPDATGLVDPAAGRGEPAADVANIGRPEPSQPPEPPEPSAGRGAAAGGAAAPGGEPARGGIEPGPAPAGGPEPGAPAAGGETGVPAPAGGGEPGGTLPIEPAPTTGSGAPETRGTAELGGNGSVPGPVGGGQGATAGEPREPRGGAGPGLVDGEQPLVRPEFQRALQRLSPERQQAIIASREATRNSGSFTVYDGRSPIRDSDAYTTHASVVVETKTLAGVKYPDLEPAYRPSPSVMGSVERRALSIEGNLDPIWAAAQQNDKYHKGFLAADDVGMGKSRTAAGFAIDRIEKGRKRILVITKGKQNVDNLMNVEFPGVLGGSTNELGGWIDIPKDFPIAERVPISGDAMPKVKKGLEDIPRFDRPAVYFLSNSEFLPFKDAVLRLQPDCVIIDEAHEFKNVGNTKTGVAWTLLHKDWTSRNADMLYLSATPGVDISDLQYLYGLKIWTMDGFTDWINIITGKEDAKTAEARQATTQALEDWSARVRQRYEDVDATEETRHMGSYQGLRTGLAVGDHLFVAPGRNAWDLYHYPEGRANLRHWEYLTDAGSEQEAAIVAEMIARDAGDQIQGMTTYELQQRAFRAMSQFKKEYPAPEVNNSYKVKTGIKEASDILAKGEKKQWFKTKRSAFESTISPAHTEQIMRELKTGGFYVSRDIARNGVEFNVKETALTPEQVARYDRRVALYQEVYAAWAQFAGKNASSDKSAATFGVTGDIQADAKRILFDMRLPGVLKEADAALARGERVVISTVSVGEVDAEHGSLNAAISKINTKAVEDLGDGKFSDPEEIPEAVIAQAELKDKLAEQGTIPSPVDVLEAHFGKGRVQFITGKTSAPNRIKWTHDFQNGKLDVIVISGAGKTGINLHDINGLKRVHLIVGDYEWSATQFKQELGRVDRTGQVSSPKVTVMHSGSAGERKFVATIANRMKGLGATSKGGAESTGTGAMNEMFELGTTLDFMALKATWEKLPYDIRTQFLDKSFQDPDGMGTAKSTISGTPETMKKFLLGLQSLPMRVGNEVMDTFMKTRDQLLAGEQAEAADAGLKTSHMEGQILRSTELAANLRLHETRNNEGHRVAILEGVLTPHMNTVRGHLVDTRSLLENSNAWMHWIRFVDPESKQIVSGLQVPISKVKQLSEAFGHLVGSAHTNEGALSDLQSGDKIRVKGEQLAEWTLRVGQGGDRTGRIIVDGAKMANRAALMNNGARYAAVGNYFYVPDENLAQFLERFPINNDRPAMAQPAEPPSYNPPDFLREQIARYQRELDQLPDTPENTNARANAQMHIDEFTRELNAQGAQPLETGPNLAAEPQPVEAPEPAPATGAPIGSVDATSEAPYAEMALEGWGAVDDVLRKVAGGLTGPGAQQRGGVTGAGTLDPANQARVRKYLGQAYADLADTKLAALRYAEGKRDFALLNYNRRTGFDNMAGSVFPYIFWYTHSGLNWALRALARPAILTNYLRLSMLSQSQQQQGFPTRLAGKMQIPMPFLPDWMGEGLYVDPLRQVFPFAQMLQPFENLSEQQTQETHKAEYILDDLVENGEVSAEDAAQAKTTHSGPVWEQAYAQAVNEVNGDIQNPMDFMMTLASPLLPLSIAYNVASGHKERISQLPATRFVQNITAPLGIGGPRGVNLEAGIRKAVGLPEGDQFEDLRINRMLANLAAEGLITTRDAETAMLEKSGPAYTLAQKRVSLAGMANYFGAPLAADLFPEGEQEQRQIQVEYGKAIDAWKNGERGALTAFYAQYPEYDARRLAFKDPATQLRSFLQSEVWDRYRALPALAKRQAAEQLGSEFQDAFLNSETRSYDSIPTQTLATWSQLLGGWAPEETKAQTVSEGGLPLKFADPAVLASYQTYTEQKKDQFPGIGDLQSLLYGLPEDQQQQFRAQYPVLNDYSKFHNSYLAEHPEVIPYVTGDSSELADVDPRVQQQVYAYRAARASLFPNFDTLMDEYLAIPAGEKSDQAYPQSAAQAKAGKFSYKSKRTVFLETHPELQRAFDYQDTYALQNPEAAPYILSAAQYQKMQTQLAQGQPPAQLSREAYQAITADSVLLRQIYLAAFGHASISAGSRLALEQIWLQLGKPGADFDSWVDEEVGPQFGVKR